MARLALAILALTLTATAQRPAAPGPESDTETWSALEASALSHVRRLIAGTQASGAQSIRLPRGGLSIPGFRILCYVRDEKGGILATRSARLRGGLFLLAWPTEWTATTRRGIVQHSDGTTMFCELDDGQEFDPQSDLVVGKGSVGGFDDVVRQPGTSVSGHLWLWLNQCEKHAKIVVVDENGAPRPDCEVALTTQNAERRVRCNIELPDGPWPTGSATTDAEGRVRVSGPPCNDLRLVVSTRTGTVVGSGMTCEVEDETLRVVLTTNAIRRAGALRNESAAIATLKNISSAQAQCQASGVIDADNNGQGEYGYFAELAGVAVVRGGKRKIAPPVLSRAFANVAFSCASRSGYLYRIYLPGAENSAIPEAQNGGAGKTPVATSDAEVLWCCYAWPANPESGQRAFFVNQGGDVLMTSNVDDAGKLQCVGIDKAPSWQAAFAVDDGMGAEVAVNKKGLTDVLWTVVF